MLQLKGCSRQKAKKDAIELLEKLNLVDKKNQMSSTLSGGMRRKLSLGIALIGNSKVSIMVKNMYQHQKKLNRACHRVQFLDRYCS
jgi:ABC-type polar amino acid transport system ATPase subunit